MKKNNKNIKSAFSADKIQKYMFRKDKKWISHNYKESRWPRTQDLPNTFVLNGAVFIASRKAYTYRKDRLCNAPTPIISSGNSGFDVDTIEDFKALKYQLTNN